MSSSTDQIVLFLRERIHRPEMYWEKTYEVEHLYKGILRRLRKVDDLSSVLSVGRPCFDYLHFYMREAGYEPGLLFEVGQRGGWYNLWLHWRKTRDVYVYNWVSVGFSDRSYHAVNDRSKAAAELMGLSLFCPKSLSMPSVKSCVKLPWDWTVRESDLATFQSGT